VKHVFGFQFQGEYNPTEHRTLNTDQEVMPSLADLLNEARTALTGPDADAEARWLVEAACGVTREQLFIHPDRFVDPAGVARFHDWLQRRRAGEPLAYITGRRAFWDFELEVTPGVLIPQPDTEVLVEQALLRLPVDQSATVADLGCGSGAVALAIARERPSSHVVAIDAYPGPITVTAHNRDRLGVAGLDIVQAHWLETMAGGCLDMIVANPPYVAAADPCLREGDVSREPRSALVAGPDGLATLNEIIVQAPRCLRPDGWLLLEHGNTQGAAVRDRLSAAGFDEVFSVTDYAANERVSGGRMSRGTGPVTRQ